MIVRLEEEPFCDVYGRPKMVLMIEFEPGEALTAELRRNLDALRYTASIAWAVIFDDEWQGPVS